MDKIQFYFTQERNPDRSFPQLVSRLTKTWDVNRKARILVREDNALTTDLFVVDSSNNVYSEIKNNDVVSPANKTYYVFGDRVAERSVIAVNKLSSAVELNLNDEDLVHDHDSGMLLQRKYRVKMLFQIIDSRAFLTNRGELANRLTDSYILCILKKNLEGSRVNHIAVRNTLSNNLEEFGIICRWVTTNIDFIRPQNSPKAELAEIHNQAKIEIAQATSNYDRDIVKTRYGNSIDDLKINHAIKKENKIRDNKRNNNTKDRYEQQLLEHNDRIAQKFIQLGYSQALISQTLGLAARYHVRLSSEDLTKLLACSMNNPESILKEISKNHKQKHKSKRKSLPRL